MTSATPKGTKGLSTVQAHETNDIAGSKDEQFFEVESVSTRDGETIRKLQPRHVALIGIGGYIASSEMPTL